MHADEFVSQIYKGRQINIPLNRFFSFFFFKDFFTFSQTVVCEEILKKKIQFVFG